MAGRRDPRRSMNVRADVALVGHERRPGVQADPHTESGPSSSDSVKLGRRGERTRRRRERDEERVPLRVHLDAVVT